MKKKNFVLLIAALIILPIAGCQVKAAENPAEKPPETSSAQAAGVAGAKADIVFNDQSNVSKEVKYSKKSLPEKFEYAVDNSFVTVVAFYNTDEIISNKVRDYVEEIINKPDFNDQISYLAYEINEKTSAKVARLTTTLGAKFLPHVFIIDGNKKIVFEDSGFTDQDYFSHALFNAVYKDKVEENDDQKTSTESPAN